MNTSSASDVDGSPHPLMEPPIRESLTVEANLVTNKLQLVPYDLPRRPGLDEISLSGTNKLISSFRVPSSNSTNDCALLFHCRPHFGCQIKGKANGPENHVFPNHCQSYLCRSFASPEASGD